MAFDYQSLIDEAMLGIVKKILIDVQNRGLGSDQSFYISFRTNYKGTVLSRIVKQKYPEEITIVLQHQFRYLKVLDDKFTVNIAFNGVAENIEVPFNAIISFLDPVANFGLQFTTLPQSLSYDKDNTNIINAAGSKPKEAKPASDKNGPLKFISTNHKTETSPSKTKFVGRKLGVINNGTNVVAIDKFRKNREENKIL